MHGQIIRSLPFCYFPPNFATHFDAIQRFRKAEPHFQWFDAKNNIFTLHKWISSALKYACIVLSWKKTQQTFRLPQSLKYINAPIQFILFASSWSVIFSDIPIDNNEKFTKNSTHDNGAVTIQYVYASFYWAKWFLSLLFMSPSKCKERERESFGIHFDKLCFCFSHGKN